MDSMFVNWEALDSLVIEFAKSENLLEDSLSPPSSPSSTSSSSPSSSSSSSSSSTSYRSRLLIRRIRRYLESGDVDSAIDLLRTYAPFVLDDHRLLFRLQKQKFIELLRKGTEEDRHLAIECLRKALAPCALDAYPEAYEEFKHVLLALIFDKDDEASPVAIEWSERRRTDIAGLLSSFLRAHLNAYDPVFSMTLRYLISIHKGYCFRQGLSSPITDLTERLLLEERDPPPIPKESLYEAPPFDEVDIQALAHAVELTRQGAIDSLRFSKGDLSQSFQNELCRMKMDVAALDELVHEYCVYRGIVDGELPSFSGIQTSGESSIINQPDNDLSKDGSSTNVDLNTCKHSGGETSVSDGCQEVNAQAMSVECTDVEMRSACEEVTNKHDGCSTSEVHNSENSRGFSRSRSYGTEERRRRKRWRGRFEMEDFNHEISYNITNKNEQKIVKKGTDQNRYEFVLEMKDFTTKGLASEVVEEINATDPSFFAQNPVLLFQLKQVEFLKLIKSGDSKKAIEIATSYLGPLSKQVPSLVKPLKETVVALLRPDEDALSKGPPLPILATSLQVAMGRRLGIEEPQLMKLMRAALHTHNEWFKLQMCKDRFEGHLKIDSLKEMISPLSTDDATSKMNVDSGTPRSSSQVTVSSSITMAEDGNSPMQVSSGDVICDENAILKVMEFLALPRADAIHLLAQYNGNAETVIQQIFA
ncbi:hypothetical protein ACHQM5_016214 [Ranunculus cassubicifolius]